jgi:NADH-quinone oxidoreductase subunit N
MTFVDVLKILPEVVLALLGIMIVVFDVTSNDTPEQRADDAASTTFFGLALAFVLVLVQGAFLLNRFVDVQNLDLRFGIFDLGLMLRNLQSVTDTTQNPVTGQANNVLLNGAFVVDNLTMLGRLIFVGAAMVTVLLARNFTRGGNPAEFYAFLIFATVGMNFMAGANEMITAYLVLELASVSLYLMAGYFKSDLRSSEAGIKYYIFGALSSGVLLYGLSLWYGYAVANELPNPTSFSTLAQALQEAPSSNILYAALLFIISGLGYKVGVVPFHSWSPDVYQGAPTPVTAFLSTASKAAGFLLLFRVLAEGFAPLSGASSLPGFSGWTSVLTLIAIATMTFGNLAAITQTNVKRLLAYSSIAQAGFLLIGLVAVYLPTEVGTVSPLTEFGTSSLIYYLVTYTFTNLGAFGALAAISRVVGGDEMSDLDGLYKRNLGLAALMALFMLSLAGIPPLAGFWAKFYVFMAGWESNAILLVVVAVANTIVSLYYYLRVLKAMFMNEPRDDREVDVPAGMNVSLITAAVGVLVLGLVPNFFLPAFSVVSQLASR